MLKIIISHFWPVIIPTLLYFILRKRMNNIATFETLDDEGNIIDATHPPKWLRWAGGSAFWVFIASFVVMVGCFIWLGLTDKSDPLGQYVPAHMENGQLIDGHVEPAAQTQP